jgi:CHAT domain-containing protein/tetratricopeptide (TPR) repeat protein
MTKTNQEVWARIRLFQGISLKEQFDKASVAENIPLLNGAIDCFLDALKFFSPTCFKDEWITCHADVASAYADLPTGDKTRHLKTAITHFQMAIAVLDQHKYPKQWITLQNRMGIAYKDLPTGDRYKNLANAIECYENALTQADERTFPYEWAMTHANLAHAHQYLPEGSEAEHIRVAITHYENALRVFTKAAHRLEWAKTQVNLAMAFGDLPTGDQVQNLRKAIASSEVALEILTPADNPREWAAAQNNLANAYSRLQVGDRSENLRHAIAHYLATLRVDSEVFFPHSWANTQYNLGICYFDLPSGNESIDYQKAIEHLEQSLRVYTKEAYPDEWARSQNALASAYLQIPNGDQEQNLRRAISRASAALEVYTEGSFPRKWAASQDKLGVAHYFLALRGTGNLAEAFDAFHAALRVRKQSELPSEWAETMSHLAEAYGSQAGKDSESATKAIDCYNVVLEAWSADSVPLYHLMILDHATRILKAQKRWSELLSMCRKGAAVLQSTWRMANDPDGRANIWRHHSELFEHAILSCIELGFYDEALTYAEQAKTRSLIEALSTRDQRPRDISDDDWRTYHEQLKAAENLRRLANSIGLQDVETATRYARTKEELSRIRKEIDRFEQQFRKSDPTYLPTATPITFPAVQSILRRAGAALIEFRVTEAETFVFLSSGFETTLTAEHVLRITEFNVSTLKELLVRRKNGRAVGGWFFKYLQFRRGEIGLADWMEVIDQTMVVLYRQLIAPVQARLSRLYPTTHRFVLVPNKGLNLLPLHLAQRESSGRYRYWMDEWEVLYAPSCQVLGHCLARVRSGGMRAQTLFAVQNPDSSLHFTDWEVEQVCTLFSEDNRRVLKGSAATEMAVRAALEFGEEKLFSCHGFFDLQDVQQSHLALHCGRLAVKDIVTTDLRNTKLVVLSACETALTEIHDTVDEYQGLPAAFLLAGAHGVVASLWAVNDFSTALLMKHFHFNVYREGHNRSFALRLAQNWLRSLRIHEVEAILDNMQTAVPNERIASLNQGSFNFLKSELRKHAARYEGKPFTNAYWWGAFQFVGAE